MWVKKPSLFIALKWLVSTFWVMPEYKDRKIPEEEEGQQRLLRTLFNVRPPYPARAEFLKVQDAYLSERIAQWGITDACFLKASQANDRIFLWQGDITTLKCDAIVNAANNALLGCFQPCHSCIDNMVHSFSGVQLRIKCNEIMLAQGHEEETGTAKITPGYNLPCKYIMHTVGPIISGKLKRRDCERLAGCYGSCLEHFHKTFISQWAGNLKTGFRPLLACAGFFFR